MEDAIGRTLYYYESEATIVGVINDFHQRSLHHAIDPIIIRLMYGINKLLVKLNAATTESLLSAIKEKYLEVFPGNQNDYYFLEGEFMSLYENEERISKIVNVFTVLGIVIAVLGLYGLVLINISKKNKGDRVEESAWSCTPPNLLCSRETTDDSCPGSSGNRWTCKLLLDGSLAC